MSAQYNQVRDQIIANEYTMVKVCDISGNALWNCEANDSKTLVDQIDSMRDIFASYGTVKMNFGKDKDKSNNGRWGVHWKVNFGSATPTPGTGQLPILSTQTSPFAQLTELMKAMQLMQSITGTNNTGAVNKDYIDQQLKLQEEKHKFAMQKLKEENEFSKYMPFAPLVMSAMGKTTDEIKSVMSLAALGSMKSLPVNGTPAAVTQNSLEEIKKMNNDQKNEAIRKEWDALAEKLPAETMLMLLQTLNKKPQLADQALDLVNKGVI